MDYLLHLIYYFTLASRSALMDAVVLVCKKLTLDAKNTDLHVALRNDFSVAFTKFFGPPDVDLAQCKPLLVLLFH